PVLVRWPGVVKAGTRNDVDFVSTVDFFPTFVDATDVKSPAGLDGRSFVALLKGESQENRQFVFSQIDSKAGGDAVPMRCVQNGQYGYIYNPFSDGKHWYRNNNEGKTMAAMQAAAENDAAIAGRINLFRYRVPEEFYDLEKDPDCLHNLIDGSEHREAIESLQAQLVAHMARTADPMLKAFLNRADRGVVDKILLETYGPPKPAKKRRNPRKPKQDAGKN
ncbi:MAG: sulfatase/phosphatase domain-containing protein, partial [Pirellulaceae bacterium]